METEKEPARGAGEKLEDSSGILTKRCFSEEGSNIKSNTGADRRGMRTVHWL